MTVPFSRKGRVEFLSLSSRKATVAFPPHLMDKKRRNPYQESNYLIHLSLFFWHSSRRGTGLVSTKRFPGEDRKEARSDLHSQPQG